MSKSLRIRLKTAILSPGMLASVCIGLVMLTWNHIYTLISYNLSLGPLTLKELGSIFLDDIYNAFSRTGFTLFAPILAVLPATILFCEDYNSGYIKSVLSRVEKKRYQKETIICSTIAGGLAIFIPCFIGDCFYVINGKPNTEENMSINYFTVFDGTVFSELQFVWDGLLLVLLLLILSFLFGAAWSNIGLCISAIIPNRYIALAAPFAIYFTSHLILYRIGGSLLLFSPANILMPATDFIPNAAYPFIYQTVLLIITFFAADRAMKRRLSNV